VAPGAAGFFEPAERGIEGQGESRAEEERGAMIRVKRVYEAAARSDGARFLVERLWPRGMKKESLHMDGWLREVSPSPELRKWFGHDPAKWAEFQRRYRRELDSRREEWRPLAEAAVRGTVTLLYSARDTERNSAALLKAYLEEQAGGGGQAERRAGAGKRAKEKTAK
jgi:uncharacterized protein YeaO (DUF488 family)